MFTYEMPLWQHLIWLALFCYAMYRTERNN